MKISTEIASCAALVGEQRAVELVARAGFDAWDFSMFSMWRWDYKNKCRIPYEHPLVGKDYLKFARELRRIGEDCGIYCNQSHAPFPSYADGIMDLLYRALECTAEAGGKICVIHPMNGHTPEENAEFFAKLLPFAKGCGVKIATENMWDWNKEEHHAKFDACCNPESFNAHLNAVNDEYLVACLDIGHAEMRGLGTTAVEMVHALGDKLQALHIHDNDLCHDNHTIPFSMNIDFPPIVKALKEIGYKGEFTLEADRHLSSFTAETAYDGMCELAESAKRLAQMFEEF